MRVTNIGVSEMSSYYPMVKLFDRLIDTLFFQLQEYQVLEDTLHIITRKYKDIAFDHTQEEGTHVHIPLCGKQNHFSGRPVSHPTELSRLSANCSGEFYLRTVLEGNH